MFLPSAPLVTANLLGVDGAIAEVEKLIGELARELDDYVGPICARAPMRTLLDSMRACWDVRDMCTKPPTLT